MVTYSKVHIDTFKDTTPSPQPSSKTYWCLGRADRDSQQDLRLEGAESGVRTSGYTLGSPRELWEVSIPRLQPRLTQSYLPGCSVGISIFKSFQVIPVGSKDENQWAKLCPFSVRHVIWGKKNWEQKLRGDGGWGTLKKYWMKQTDCKGDIYS